MQVILKIPNLYIISSILVYHFLQHAKHFYVLTCFTLLSDIYPLPAMHSLLVTYTGPPSSKTPRQPTIYVITFYHMKLYQGLRLAAFKSS